MQAFENFRSTIAPLAIDHIDTDQIIPARYLKVTTKDGLGEGLFADWRNDPEFPLNLEENQNASILLAGDNFGCGSSREHAPWALMAGGFKAVIAPSFADIFRNNALKNGLLPIAADKDWVASMFRMRADNPRLQLHVNLETQIVSHTAGSNLNFEIHPFAKECLMKGVDQLGYLLRFEESITRFEASHEGTSS